MGPPAHAHVGSPRCLIYGCHWLVWFWHVCATATVMTRYPPADHWIQQISGFRRPPACGIRPVDPIQTGRNTPFWGFLTLLEGGFTPKMGFFDPIWDPSQTQPGRLARTAVSIRARVKIGGLDGVSDTVLPVSGRGCHPRMAPRGRGPENWCYRWGF